MNGNSLRILVANNHLDTIGGTEVYAYTVIEELVKRKYEVEYFTFTKGVVSEIIENDLNVKFMTKKKYDLILANHISCVRHLFNRGIIIQTCHGKFPELEQPSKYADFHVSISNEVKEYLNEKGIKSKIILNGINLNRFKNYRNVNKTLQNILSLSHSEEVNKLLSEVCKEKGYNFTSINKKINPIWELESVINENDLIIGIGRSAYDAISCGRNVLVFDYRGYVDKAIGDGYLKQDNIEKFLLFNLSGRYSNRTFNKETIIKELEEYSTVDADFNRIFAEKNLNIVDKIDEYLDLYFQLKKNYIFLIMKNFKIIMFKYNLFVYTSKVFIHNLICKIKFNKI